MAYIGETGRRLCIRVGEHNGKSSQMKKHLLECNHNFNKNRFNILATNFKGKNQNIRKKYETMVIQYIEKNERLMNICKGSRKLGLFGI